MTSSGDARPLIGAGLSCGAMGLWMVYDSKIGKVREREDYLDKIVWRGDERVLEVGCGLGLFSSARPSDSGPAARSGSTCGRPRISAGTRRPAAQQRDDRRRGRQG